MKTKNQFTLMDRVLLVVWTTVIGTLLLAVRWYLPGEAIGDTIIVVIAALTAHVTVKFRILDRELTQLGAVVEKQRVQNE